MTVNAIFEGDQHIADEVNSKRNNVVMLRLDRGIQVPCLDCPIKSGNDDELTKLLCNVKVDLDNHGTYWT